MRIQLWSDLHLENQPGVDLQLAPGVDVLVLAGDIGSYQQGSQLQTDDFGLGRFAPARWADKPGVKAPTVLYVPGNHEYDQCDFDTTHRRLREVCEAHGIHWLERECMVLDGVRFIGTTLWADFEALAHTDAKGRRMDEVRRAQQRDKAFRAADFYLRKYSATHEGQTMLAPAIRELGLQCQAWLRGALDKPFAGPTVVVTHFAPSVRSADPRYGLAPGTAGFCNALDDLLPLADLWLHGHLHCPHDYVVEPPAGAGKRCRVVANPLGYIDKGEAAAFRPDWIIEP